MKKLAVILSVVVSVWVLSPTPQAHASWWGDLSSHVTSWWDSVVNWFSSNPIRPHTRHTTAPPSARVPELDPSAAGAAIVLMLGGVAYIASRRRKEDLG
ncbi:MAG: hypothetical protein OER77_17395 [Myxococcales bacterium]|nr:hypothetical protein [Myxococcales bacterium]